MPATKVQLINGSFQDAEGNVLALGYLKFVLNQDAQISGVGNIASGIEITITLDVNGNVSVSPVQSIWGNDQMLPINSYYRVTGYTAAGQPAWGPNNQQVTGSGGTFNLDGWIPNQIISWSPSNTQVLLETNGTVNGSQNKLNLVNGTGVTITQDGAGDTTINASGTPLTLQVDGTPNGSQTLLNINDQLSDGFWVDNGNGTISLGNDFYDDNWAQLASGVTTLQPNPFNIVVSSMSLTSNVLTINFAPAHSGSWGLPLSAGDTIYLGQFGAPFTFLNGTAITLTTINMFTGIATAPVTHANIALTSISGFAGVGFQGVVSYGASSVNAVPTPAVVVPVTTTPANPGFLYFDITPDWSSFVIKSTNASDNAIVNFSLVAIWF